MAAAASDTLAPPALTESPGSALVETSEPTSTPTITVPTPAFIPATAGVADDVSVPLQPASSQPEGDGDGVSSSAPTRVHSRVTASTKDDEVKAAEHQHETRDDESNCAVNENRRSTQAVEADEAYDKVELKGTSLLPIAVLSPSTAAEVDDLEDDLFGVEHVGQMGSSAAFPPSISNLADTTSSGSSASTDSSGVLSPSNSSNPLIMPPLLSNIGLHDSRDKLIAPPPSLQVHHLRAGGSTPSSQEDGIFLRATETPTSFQPAMASFPTFSPAPPPSSSSSSLSSLPYSDPRFSAVNFPFWIGCWNMGAKELAMPPPQAIATGGGSDTSASKSSSPPSPFSSWIPTGYRLYVIGLQESISETTYKALDGFFAQKQFDCVRLQIPVSSSTTGEQLSGTLGGTIKIEGRGDGSFIYPKCTSLAVWVQRQARQHVEYCAHGALSLGMTQGSKGGAALALKIVDTTMVFVSCHLSSTTLASRRQSYSSLVESVGNALGERYFQLLEQFHHCFFLGDLNFRLAAGVSAAEAVKYMQRLDVKGLFAFDELATEMATGSAFGPFTEAPIDFFPTYKKHEGRTIPGPPKDNIYWVHAVYKTIYKQPWYKTGNTAQRVPSWCDRIIRHSLQDQKDRVTVLINHPEEPREEIATTPAAVAPPATATTLAPPTSTSGNRPSFTTSPPSSGGGGGRSLSKSVGGGAGGAGGSSSLPKQRPPRIGGVGALCTYRALEDGLSGSDHSAVSCGFNLALSKPIDWAAGARGGSVSGGKKTGNATTPGNGKGAALTSTASPSTTTTPAVASQHKASSSHNLFLSPSSIPPTRSASSSVSSPSPRVIQGPMPTVYIVRLLSVRVLQAPPSPAHQGLLHLSPIAPDAFWTPHVDVGMEPKYVRILFPAPFEAGMTPSVSRQVTFTPATQQLANPQQQLQRVAQIVSQAVLASSQALGGSIAIPSALSATISAPLTSPASAPPSSHTSASPSSTSGASGLPRSTSSDLASLGGGANGGGSSVTSSPRFGPLESAPWRAEFRCLSFDDEADVRAAEVIPGRKLPPPAPYHFLLKIHSADDISGQCVVALPRESFAQKHVLEFRSTMTRDGLPLVHPYTKQTMQVSFFLALDSARPTVGETAASTPNTSTPFNKARSSKQF